MGRQAAKRRIGLMGGTFDPIHFGHLVTAEEARVQFRLEKVIFIPNRHPPLKDPQEVTDPEHRYLMTVLATVGNPYFTVSRIEIDRPGPSYTIDTLREFIRLYPDADLFFITGADALLQILRGMWHGARELLQMCQFIAASRPGYVLDREQLERNNLTGNDLRNVHAMEIPALAISSTDIRERVRQGRPIKYLVPEPVEDYILKHGLYRGKATREGEEGG